MLNLQVRDGGLWFGESLLVRFLRTVRVDDADAQESSLPDFGTFPMFCASDYPDATPPAWRVRPSIVIPMYRQEAMRIRFSPGGPKATAVKIGIDDLDALTGHPWHERLSSRPQNYVVCPGQSRLNGYVTGDGSARQFTAPLPLLDDDIDGCEIERCNWSHLWLMVLASRQPWHPGPHTPQRLAPGLPGPVSPPAPWERAASFFDRREIAIHPDRHGLHTWDSLNRGCVSIYLVSDSVFQQITGKEAPASPVPVGLYGPHVPCFASHGDSTAAASDENPPKTRYTPWVRRRHRRAE